jgi:DNA helicase-2/ATP-dependent DNA helicase PcrA
LREQHPTTPTEFISETERLQIIRQLAKLWAFKEMTARELSLAISKQKGSVTSQDNALATLVAAYDDELRARNMLDFDDLLSQTYAMLKDNETLRNSLEARYKFILIDEFQDTSELQWALVEQLRGNDNIFVIGDPKQSIYSFRGAGAEMFEVFRKAFPDHRAVTLQTNYRSTKAIVALSNQVYPHDEPLQAHSHETGSVQAVQTLNEYSEADLVLETIERGIGGSDMLKASESEGRHFRDFAVLYRTHQSAKVVQQRLHDSGIPVQIVGEGSPYERAEIQAVIESFTWLLRREQLPGVKGLSAAQLQVLLEGIDATRPVSVVAQSVIESLGLEGDNAKRRAHLGQFVSTLVRFDTQKRGLERCVEYIEQLAQTDFYDPQADAVTLLTIHASKGLEFTHVVLIAAEEGTLPHIRKAAEPNIAEERRLFYVALTRAKQRLDITYAKKRAGEDRAVSRFITDVKERFLPRIADPQLANLEKKVHRRQQKNRQATLF